MRYCGYCGAELPEYARFCRMCGSNAAGEVKNALDVINPSPLPVPSPETPLPLFNVPTLLPSNMEDSDEEMKKTLPSGAVFDPQTWTYLNRESDDYRTIDPEVIAPPAAGFGQIPASNVPVMPGTPQIGGVPSVEGTPHMGNMPGGSGGSHLAAHAPAPQELAHQAPASAPQHTWNWEHHPTLPHHHAPPEHLQPIHHQQHSIPPEHHEPPRKTRWWHRRRREKQRHRQTRSAHTSHAHHTAVATASKATTGIVAKWAIIILAAVVVMASGGIIFVLASSPALSLTSSGTVAAGGTLQLHGRGFVPGGSVTLTVDNGLPVTLAEARPVPGTRSDSGAADLADMLNNGQASNSNGTISVGLTGTFDARVIAQASWPAGRNILHAKENSGSRSADVPFILLAQAARLSINPTSLDFGAIPQNSKVAESILVGNSGGSPLTWSATTDGSSWLALQQSSGTLQPGSMQEALYALVNTANLSQQVYTAMITIHSNGGNAQIAVRMQVAPPAKAPQAKLNINPPALDFGQLSPGQQVSDTLTIGNQGTLALQWQASVRGAPWLSLGLSSGSVQAGGLPQSIQVTVDTTNSSLQPGSNTTSILIHSNGGDATIPVTLTLQSGATPTPTPSPTLIPSPSPTPSPTLIPSPSPSPTPSPTPSPSPTPTPVIQVTPNSIDQSSSSCSLNSDTTYTCTVSVGESTPGSLSWFAPTGIGENITFTPPNGQFSPGITSQSVTIAEIPCANNSFTFTDQNNNTATVNWSCQPTPTPEPTVIPSPSPSPSVVLGSGTWQDPYGGSSYDGDAVTMQLTVQGSTFSGTLTGQQTGDNTPVQGQDGVLSSFSANDQQYLNFVVQNYGSQTGILVAFTISNQFEGAPAGCQYYGVLEQNGNIEGFWYFPNSSVDAGSVHMNKVS